MRASVAIAVLLSVGGLDGVAVQRAADRGAEGLNPKIPAAVPASYKDIRDAKDWRNPKITIRAEGIEVESTGIPKGRTTVAADDLRMLLISLPASAWPYRPRRAGVGYRAPAWRSK